MKTKTTWYFYLSWVPLLKKKANQIYMMDWWAMNLPRTSARGTRVSCQQMTQKHTLSLRHLDDKKQLPHCSQIASIHHNFCWRQLTFTSTDFPSHSLKWVARVGEAQVFISLSLPAASYTYSQRGANYNLYLPTATSKCHIDSCPLIYKSLIKKEPADIFTSF